MPDVSRSDSNRSDASRPRVSFNRNVHVKRINGPNTASAYSISPDGTTFMPTSIRRERPMTKKEMTQEAEEVLKQVDKVSCKAMTNLQIEEDKQKQEKKKRKTFSFLKRNETDKKWEKRKNSSSDVDSGSSQEYRIYRVNGPTAKSEGFNSVGNEKHFDDEHRRKKEIKNYDFMSLDRKRLKKERKKESLDYLSLEKNVEALNKMKKDKFNRTLVSVVFDREDGKSKRPASERKENHVKHSEESEIQSTFKKQTFFTGSDHIEKKRGKKIDQILKKLSETTSEPLTKNTGNIGIKEPQSEMCHNENRPFSYTNVEDDNFKAKTISRAAMEGLGVGKEDSKCVSPPTNDVIYAQVIVGGRDGNVQQSTVNERVASDEVGSVFVGEDPNRSQVGINYNINGKRNEEICVEKVTVKSGEHLKKEVLNNTKMLSTENNRTSPGSIRDDYTRIVKVSAQSDFNKCGDKYASDLHDLSIRREILLSRSESQAKERFNSLKRLQEPSKIKRTATNLNGVKQAEKLQRNESRFSEKDNRLNNKLEPDFRKKREEGVGNDNRRPESTNPKKKRESKLDAYLKEKADIWKNIDKVHLIKTDDDDDNLLRKLTKFGKSKSFEQDRPNPKKIGKMKMLFKKKKEGKGSESEEDPLAARYVEYRGSDVDLSDKSTESSPRRPAFLRPGDFNREPNDSKLTSLRFFGDTDQESTTNDFCTPKTKVKNDLYRSGKITDSDEDHHLLNRPDSRMNDSLRRGSPTGKKKSKYDLDNPDYGLKQMNHGLNLSANKHDNPYTLSESHSEKDNTYDINGMKYLPNIKRSASSLTNPAKYGTKEKLRNLKSTPIITVTSPRESLSRRVKSHGNLYTQDEGKGGRRRFYDSSAESATEGDNSQNSSKSMIYLHAATVGDIPGPRNIYKSNKRSQSREELSSAEENSTISPSGKKTLSRSFSVLAPWRPKHDKEDKTLHYDSAIDIKKGKPPTGTGKNKMNSAREKKAGEFRFNTLGKENRRRKDLLR